MSMHIRNCIQRQRSWRSVKATDASVIVATCKSSALLPNSVAQRIRADTQITGSMFSGRSEKEKPCKYAPSISLIVLALPTQNPTRLCPAKYFPRCSQTRTRLATKSWCTFQNTFTCMLFKKTNKVPAIALGAARL